VIKALVVGSAECVWEDVKNATNLTTFDRVYCVKMAGAYWPGHFDFWVTLHPELLPESCKERRLKGLPLGYQTVAPPQNELGVAALGYYADRRVSYCWPGMNASAGSGIYGAKVALDDGCDRVVLAGIPMTKMPFFYKHRINGTKAWSGLDSFMVGLSQAIGHMRGKVRSMSGRTKELLGAPDAEWFVEPTSGMSGMDDDPAGRKELTKC